MAILSTVGNSEKLQFMIILTTLTHYYSFDNLLLTNFDHL